MEPFQTYYLDLRETAQGGRRDSARHPGNAEEQKKRAEHGTRAETLEKYGTSFFRTNEQKHASRYRSFHEYIGRSE